MMRPINTRVLKRHEESRSPIRLQILPQFFSNGYSLLFNYSYRLSNQPEYIMLENVKGFDTSEAHELLIETLRKCRYRFEEFLLSPIQFSIPNSRQRYYLIARKSNDIPVGEYAPNIHLKVPFIGLNCSIFSENAKVDFADHIALNMEGKVPQIGDLRSPIGAYLEEDNAELPPLQITNDTLLRYHMLFDIVDPNSTSCNCFTKSYAHRIEGCGSILKTSPASITIDQIYAEIGKLKEQQPNRETRSNQAIVDLLRSLEFRYFSPKEIANLMCFPPEFGLICLCMILNIFLIIIVHFRVSLQHQSQTEISRSGKFCQCVGLPVSPSNITWFTRIIKK